MNKEKIMRQVRVNAKLAKRKVKDGFYRVKQWFKDILESQIVIELQENEFVIKESEHECKCGGNCKCHEEDHHECKCGGNCKCHNDKRGE